MDATSQTGLLDLLAELRRKMAVVVVTHDPTPFTPSYRHIACLNRRLYWHERGGARPPAPWRRCTAAPVEILGHGIPHTLLADHHDQGTRTWGAAVSEILSYEFMRNAILAGILASLVCGVIGPFIVTKRMVFISGGLSHTAFGGLGIAYWLGIRPLFGAMAFVLAAAVVISRLEEKKLNQNDLFIGILWAVGVAVGILFIHVTPGVRAGPDGLSLRQHPDRSRGGPDHHGDPRVGRLRDRGPLLQRVRGDRPG